ncbi:hypothetical protein [Oceanicoccus sagamiensis]|uniref:Histidine kinase N-terminal 7TM region domain-containing protein n=1 Tax=Oceanicoccus sagamiensis TaxID=716816 RepID=A0A1X9NFH2_9GAMM|nr:hypothetical protein [Oceanicoccus sagamiensis]ARN74269.1 hypothetical protein BST96_09130 [Oceanicoccus sagamiensis]
MNPTSVIAASSVMLAILLVTAIYNVKGGNRYANRVLALFVAISALYLASLVPLHSALMSDYPMIRVTNSLVFLFGPLLYSYVKAMTIPGFKLGRADLVHIVPFVLLVFIGLSAFWLPEMVTTNVSPPTRKPEVSIRDSIGIVYYALLTLYGYLSVRCLQQHRASIQTEFSNLEGISLRWLYILVMITVAIASLGLLIALARAFTDIQFWPRGIYSMTLMISIYYLIAFMGITQPQIFGATVAEAPAAAKSDKPPPSIKPVA